MNALRTEFLRLYAHPDAPPANDDCALSGQAADGSVRALRLLVLGKATWPAVEALWRGVQSDDGLPAPAISVEATGGYALWFSLTAPVAANLARRFVDELSARYLAELPPDQIIPLVGDDLPALPFEHDGRWSAFIDPGLGSLFADDSGLDFAPGPERQLPLLAGLTSMRLAPISKAPASPTSPAERSNLGSGYSDPAAFLFAVMNDSTASTRDRIEAAKALLAHGKGQA